MRQACQKKNKEKKKKKKRRGDGGCKSVSKLQSSLIDAVECAPLRVQLRLVWFGLDD